MTWKVSTASRQAERIAALYLQVATLTSEEVEHQVKQRGQQARA